jgi:hypothetical protein
MTTHEIPIGDIMPGVTIGLAESDVVTTAICIALVVPMEGDDPTPSLVLKHTPGTDWITQRGMLQAALDIERNVGSYYDLEDGEDDL